jgi:transposase-like protein
MIIGWTKSDTVHCPRCREGDVYHAWASDEEMGTQYICKSCKGTFFMVLEVEDIITEHDKQVLLKL